MAVSDSEPANSQTRSLEIAVSEPRRVELAGAVGGLAANQTGLRLEEIGAGGTPHYGQRVEGLRQPPVRVISPRDDESIKRYLDMPNQPPSTYEDLPLIKR